MYERFTDRARKVMQLANREAQCLKRGDSDAPDVLVVLHDQNPLAISSERG